MHQVSVKKKKFKCEAYEESFLQEANLLNHRKLCGGREANKNKAVYTTAPEAGGRAGAIMIWAGAVMLWAGAVMIWAGACSNTNFQTLKLPKNGKKNKV